MHGTEAVRTEPAGFGRQWFRILCFVSMAFLLALGCGSKDPDLNNDGVVNILDVSLVSSCLGQDPATDPTCRGADTNGDGVIDQADLDLVVANFNSPTPCGNLPQGSECDDGNACTVSDTCQANGSCVGEPAICQDGNDCTADSCDVASGCVFTITPGQPCSDDSFCTIGDTCTAAATCLGTPVVCEDSNDCTADSCEPASGCVFAPRIGASCDDGSVCTLGETCLASGACGGGSPLPCDDGNSCTFNTCNPIAGCQFPVDVGASCSDGDGCTENDLCQTNGSCSGSLAFANCCEGNADCATSATCCMGIAFPDPGLCILPGEG